MKRVAVTGLGIVSSIGNNKEEVTTSLREGKSGISFAHAQPDNQTPLWVGSMDCFGRHHAAGKWKPLRC